MVEVERLLSATSPLTLAGSGGCGKTRLAVEVAAGLVGACRDGAWFVDLAPLSDPALVPHVVAEALEAREQPGRSLTDTLVDCLQPRETLLLLDNCEHLLDACARLAQTLLSECRQLACR